MAGRNHAADVSGPAGNEFVACGHGSLHAHQRASRYTSHTAFLTGLVVDNLSPSQDQPRTLDSWRHHCDAGFINQLSPGSPDHEMTLSQRTLSRASRQGSGVDLCRQFNSQRLHDGDRRLKGRIAILAE